MISILSCIDEYMGIKTIEFSHKASLELIEQYANGHNIIIDSDAHHLEDISSGQYYINIEKCDAKSIINYLRKI